MRASLPHPRSRLVPRGSHPIQNPGSERDPGEFYRGLDTMVFLSALRASTRGTGGARDDAASDSQGVAEPKQRSQTTYGISSGLPGRKERRTNTVWCRFSSHAIF